MFSILRTLLLICWALWYGGMMALLLFVIRLFGVSRQIGVISAPILFDSFANNQLIVGGVTCLLGTILVVCYRRRSHATFTLILLSVFAVAIVTRSWTHEIDLIRLMHQTDSARFKALHARSGLAYVYAAVALLISGIGWINAEPTSQTFARTEPATDSPDAASA